jgi:hypothetical protein
MTATERAAWLVVGAGIGWAAAFALMAYDTWRDLHR